MLTAIAGTSFAQQGTTAGTAYTLEECVQYALRNQNNVVNARLNRQMSVEKIRETRGRLFPHANITGNFTDNLKLQTSLIPDFTGDPNNKIPVQFGTKYSSAVTGEVTQTLINSDYFLGLKAAKVYDELSIRDYERTAIDTRVQVSVAYFNVLVSMESIRLLDANLAQFGKTLKDTRARYDQGVAERIDVDRIQTSFNSVETQRANLQRQLEYTYDVLKFQMGMPLDSAIEVKENIREFTDDMPDSLNYRFIDRPEYAMQRVQVELDRLNLRSKKLQIIPTLNAFVNYGFNYFSERFGDLYKTGFGTSAVGVRLSWPIFNGTERLYQARQLAITLQQSQNNLNYLSQQIQLEVRNGWTQYRSNLASLNTQEKNMALTQGVYDRVVLKYEEGVATSLDVLSADSELKQAQNDYINALINTLISKVKLDQAMGKIKAE
ncbi:TolC family protein [Chitinophaga deserti]|uniref:TolC family protein n=1 Tax=Chitinophaga deserti TaxID=2164099 RepID=UPI001E2ABF8B|nr:TolC family protein [Chitinophaga deserti]